MPIMPDRLYDFCTVHFELFLLKTRLHLQRPLAQVNEKIPQVVLNRTEPFWPRKSSATGYWRDPLAEDSGVAMVSIRLSWSGVKIP